MMSELVLQIAIVLFAVRGGGILAQKLKIPSVLGELLAGIVIGPYALGGIALPGFPEGIFPLGEGTLAVSPELYGFSTVASIILLFASGLETDLSLFMKYSLAGGIIGIGGVVFSFIFGDAVGMFFLDATFADPRCLFLGVLCTATSVGITARILSDRKKMDSPEGVTILAAAVFDDVLGIIILAVVLGLVSAMSGASGEALNIATILGIAGKAFGIWLGFTVLGLVFAKKIAGFLKLFKSSFDFSILSLGIALLLAGIFEKQGLAMIIGAYVTGLSLSKTDIAAVIQERIHGLYEFFVPLFFAVSGMLVNVRELFSVEVAVFGFVYSVIAILSKLIGCGLPSLALGFNGKGAMRIGMGMVPRGEVALIIAGIGLSSGILNEQLFGVVIMMTLVTTLVAPPFLNLTLSVHGRGTRKISKDDDTATATWDFENDEIADLVVDNLLKELRAEGFYVQMMNIDDGLSQARKDDISLSIIEEESCVTIETSHQDMLFVKQAVYEVVVKLYESIAHLKQSNDPVQLKKETAEGDARTDKKLFEVLDPTCISLDLKGTTKDEVLEELVNILAFHGKLSDRDSVLEAVKEREKVMSTGMQHAIALPHGKSDGVDKITIAIGIKKDGIDFDSLDKEKSKLFILLVSPKKYHGPHIQTLSAISAILSDTSVVEKIISSKSPEEVLSYFNK